MIAVRVDASAQIGTGHLIRCLTLADALKAAGASTLFLCRHIMPQLAALVTGKGHALARLPAAPLAQEANPLPRLNLARNPIEQGGPAIPNPQILDADEGHEASAEKAGAD